MIVFRNAAGPGPLVALTAGVAAVATLAAPTANATCLSFFGIGSGGQCTSSATSIAVAFGTDAEAHAEGLLGVAFTLGNASSAVTAAGGLLNLAVTVGDGNLTSAGGIASLAAVANGVKQTVIAGDGDLVSGNFGNLAVSQTSPEATQTVAGGIGNISLNLAGSWVVAGAGVGLTTFNVLVLGADLINLGVLNNITNLSGDNNTITNNVGDGGIGTVAFNLVGSDNVISANGPLAAAGAIGSAGQTVAQHGFGVNIAVGRQ